jgi:hypothetical protein
LAVSVRDPAEGVSPQGTIVTGVDRRSVAAPFEDVLVAAVEEMGAERSLGAPGLDAPGLYVYGSVATGRALRGRSDVDLLAIGLPSEAAARIGADLSRRFAGRCRGVELATVGPSGLDGEGDQAYGNRVFLRHYCAHVAGPDPARGLPRFPADVRAARGFNGDIDRHLAQWRSALAAGDEPAHIARRMARKTLLAVAGLVSIREQCWTTDRDSAAQRWSHHDPANAEALSMLVAWSNADLDADVAVDVAPTRAAVQRALVGTVADLARTFELTIGLWSGPPVAGAPIGRAP